MNSKEAIIDKILRDAKDVATNNKANAMNHADELLKRAEREVEAKKAEALAGLDSIKDTLIERRITVANLDAKKAVLTRKSELIDEIFARSVEAVVADKGYAELIEGMLMEYAEDGDEVMINERDKDIVTKALVDKVAKAKKINLRLSKSYGKFGGGIMLIGVNVDKNLTIDSELRAMREEIEQQVAEILFGE